MDGRENAEERDNCSEEDCEYCLLKGKLTIKK
jgi:hypothetical protein